MQWEFVFDCSRDNKALLKNVIFIKLPGVMFIFSLAHIYSMFKHNSTKEVNHSKVPIMLFWYNLK